MKLIKVAAAVLNQTPLAWDSNKAHILSAIEEARRQGVSILCLPELCITGYGCEDAFLARGVHELSMQVLQECLPATEGMIVTFGLPILHHNAVLNCQALVCDGKILGLVAKQHLAGDGLHYEPRWFKPWPDDLHSLTTVAGKPVPLGNLYFDCGGVRIGFEICEDAWVAKRPGGDLSQKGVDIILNPSASHFAFGKHEIRKRFVLEGSRAFGVSYVYANMLGNESGRAIYDGDTLIATNGKLVAVGPRFSFGDVVVTSAVVDVDLTRMNQARTASYQPRLSDDLSDCIRADFHYPELEPVMAVEPDEGISKSPHVKEEEFTRALCLGLFDYLRKSRLEGFVVSLSGGADSSACCSFVSLLVELGAKELGFDGLMKKLAYSNRLQGATSPKDLIHRMLLCVYQSTRNSGQVTRNAARSVAEALGAEYAEWDIDKLVTDYVEKGEKATGRHLDWKTDDVPLQNIQARVRSPGVWLLANLRNSLLLSTSNRSEAAVGYATMDGDTSGGLSPIAGIDKAYLRRYLRWLEKEGPQGLHPIPALKAVNEQQPTAELRPQESKQTDEDDLMPYELLDAIERAAIRDKQMPLEVFQQMRVVFPQIAPQQLGVWVERFFRLFCRNQWKRERYAPSFHLDDENLDPKTWCRFPILNSGFERELRGLRAFLA